MFLDMLMENIEYAKAESENLTVDEYRAVNLMPAAQAVVDSGNGW
jgi:hypothetical protein